MVEVDISVSDEIFTTDLADVTDVVTAAADYSIPAAFVPILVVS